MNGSTERGGDGLLCGDPGAGYEGTIGRTLRESTPWWPVRPRAPVDAPSLVVVLLDDLGFSDFGCYGAEIRTPRIDALAHGGLRFSNYTTVPMCTPARAALLTGKNPHAVGCGWLTFNLPGYPGYQAGEIARDAPTLAELLRANGYSTYAAGKWHNTAHFNVLPSGERASWPIQRGFDRFYGFVGGETHYFAPAQLVSDNAIVDCDRYRDGYYATDDFTDVAIGWLKAHVSASPDKPFFLYLPYNAPHAPLHAKDDDLARYAQAYDDGWDAARRARVARQYAMGMHPREWPLPARSNGVPAWESLDANARRLHARFMALYAAVVDNVDQNVGRVVDCLAALGRLDDTLILVTSDNGANGIGGPDGAINNLAKRLVQREDPAWVREMLEYGRVGGAASWPAYSLGWTDVSTAPFRLYKTTTMNGGIRVPLVAHWPRGIADRGAIRQQFVHVTDIVPTILDLLDARYPEGFAGYRTRTLDGVSFRPALDAATAKSSRTRQHYELAGNRGYIDGRWKIVSLQPPGTAIDLSNWMLFDLANDATETQDLATEQPGKLRELVAAFDADAYANHVYPLDNRGVHRSLTVPPFLEASVNAPRTFYPGCGTAALAAVAPMVADRDYRIDCSFGHDDGDEGVVFALGDPIAGMALFVRDRRLCFVYHGGEGKPVVRDALPLCRGDNRFVLDHRATGARRGQGTLSLNGQVSATLDMSPTTILGLGVGEGLDVGCDRRLHVSPLYERDDPFAYTGVVSYVRIEPGAQAHDSYANRPEREAQGDRDQGGA
ncbi:MAG TPA: arylsulfatase [Casimicrobiaceae bacterium]|nr:arylsulfatase [Casimicrobiaceae bacterium]